MNPFEKVDLAAIYDQASAHGRTVKPSFREPDYSQAMPNLQAPAERGCGKAGYPSKKDALTKANRIHRTGRAELRAYECPCCHQWHLTRNGVSYRNRGESRGGRRS